MKKIIFFDADGSLWYPKKTKRNQHLVWLYKDKRYKRYEQYLELIPDTVSTLKKLKSLGITTIILSTSPYPTKKANQILIKKVNHFELNEFFDEVHATKDIPSSKGEYIEKILKKRGISKKSALMVGDSYKWGIITLLNQGVLMHCSYKQNTRKISLRKNILSKIKRHTETDIKRTSLQGSFYYTMYFTI
jgi:FMN phosphatase YigB (HAD superfamily)